MANKKKNNSAEPVEQNAAKQNGPQKKLSKKEKKALAEQKSKELNQKKMRNYGIGFVLALIAVIVSFTVKPETGTAQWSYVQMSCYALMAVAGIFLKNGAKYEENPKRVKNMDMIGLIFIVICLGMIMAEVVALLAVK